MANITRDSADRLILSKELRRFFGDCSDATLWRKMKSGAIPPPIKLANNLNAWWLSEIHAAIDALPRGIVAEQSPRSRLPSPLAPE